MQIPLVTPSLSVFALSFDTTASLALSKSTLLGPLKTAMKSCAFGRFAAEATAESVPAGKSCGSMKQSLPTSPMKNPKLPVEGTSAATRPWRGYDAKSRPPRSSRPAGRSASRHLFLVDEGLHGICRFAYFFISHGRSTNWNFPFLLMSKIKGAGSSCDNSSIFSWILVIRHRENHRVSLAHGR